MNRTLKRLAVATALLAGLGVMLAGRLQDVPPHDRSTASSDHISARPDSADADTAGTDAGSVAGPPPRPKRAPNAAASDAPTVPYRGIYACTVDCSDQTVLNDPLVAADALEANWMESRGFPTPEELEWATAASADDVDRRAEAENSNRLRLLALWRRAMTSTDVVAISQMGAQIGAAARRERLFYGLYLESDAYMRAFDLAATANVSGGRLPFLQRAAESLKLAVMLGDTKAVALYARIPHAYATPTFWGSVDRSVVTQLHVGGFFPQDGLPSFAMVEYRPNTRAEQRFRASRAP